MDSRLKSRFKHCFGSGLQVIEPAIGEPYVRAEEVERLLAAMMKAIDLAGADVQLPKKPQVHP